MKITWKFKLSESVNLHQRRPSLCYVRTNLVVSLLGKESSFIKERSRKITLQRKQTPTGKILAKKTLKGIILAKMTLKGKIVEK